MQQRHSYRKLRARCVFWRTVKSGITASVILGAAVELVSSAKAFNPFADRWIVLSLGALHILLTASFNYVKRRNEGAAKRKRRRRKPDA